MPVRLAMVARLLSVRAAVKLESVAMLLSRAAEPRQAPAARLALRVSTTQVLMDPVARCSCNLATPKRMQAAACLYLLARLPVIVELWPSLLALAVSALVALSLRSQEPVRLRLVVLSRF